jgi:hypothetical protein
MLEDGIIVPIEKLDWISLMVVQPKKKSDISICVDLCKLNVSYVHDPFPTQFTVELLENVGGCEAYSFSNGFLGCHHVWIAEEYQAKTMFTTEWSSFPYKVMLFGLKNEPAIFSRIVVIDFKGAYASPMIDAR